MTDLTRLDHYIPLGLPVAVVLFCLALGWYWPVPGPVRLVACGLVGLAGGWAIR